MTNTKLFCTFTDANRLSETIETIRGSFDIVFGKVFVLKNINDPNEFFCTYNVGANVVPSDAMEEKTIPLHRKKDTNTLYTINALNYLINLLNDGIHNSRFEVPWTNYRNTLLVTNAHGLRQISTKLHGIISH